MRTLDKRAWGVLLIVLLLGASVEWIGVETGFPFGRYAYTERWWPTIPMPSGGRFPLLVPFAWFLMAGASYLAVSRKNRVSVLVGGFLAALLDLAMEPVMVGPLGYWRWLDGGPLPGGVPIANFLGWFVTSCLAGLALHSAGAWKVEDRRDPQWVLAGHSVLTLGIGAISLLP